MLIQMEIVFDDVPSASGTGRPGTKSQGPNGLQDPPGSHGFERTRERTGNSLVSSPKPAPSSHSSPDRPGSSAFALDPSAGDKSTGRMGTSGPSGLDRQSIAKNRVPGTNRSPRLAASRMPRESEGAVRGIGELLPFVLARYQLD
jgi:hypothetical protein